MAYGAACKIDPSLTGPFMARNKAGDMHLFDSQRQWVCEGMPPLVIEAVDSFGGLTPLANSDPNFARQQFIKIFDQLAARERRYALLPEAIRKQIAAVSEKRLAAPPAPTKLAIGVFKDGA